VYRIMCRRRPKNQVVSPRRRAVADRRGIGIGFGWLQNAWLLLHARLKILTRGGGGAPTCTHKMVQYTRTGRAPVSGVLIGCTNGLLR
jgi:hypothetical protein